MGFNSGFKGLKLVGLMTKLMGWASEESWLDSWQQRDISLLQNAQTGTGNHSGSSVLGNSKYFPPGGGGGGVKLSGSEGDNSHFHLVRKLRMSGATLPLPTCIHVMHCNNFPFTLPYNIYCIACKYRILSQISTG